MKSAVVARLVWLWLLFLLSTSASGSDLERARQDIRSTYDFEPSEMSFAEQAKRAPNLGKLWSRYDAEPSIYLKAIREELRSEGGRELLYCDGGMLLLAKSSIEEDKALGLSSIRKCSLAEIQHTPYFYTLHKLAVEGVDTFDLQVRMLEKPNYSVYIVPHALTLGQDYAFVYPLLVREESLYAPRLMELLEATADSKAKRSIALALWYSANSDAESTLRSLASSSEVDDELRKELRQRLDYLSELRQAADSDQSVENLRALVGVALGDSETVLRQKRTSRMRSISDEALIELDALTFLIYRART